MMIVRKYFASVLWFFGLLVAALTAFSVATMLASYLMGSSAPYVIGVQYGQLIVICLAIAAILGTTFGVLPLTRHRSTPA